LSPISGHSCENQSTWEKYLKFNLKNGILEKEELLRRAEWEEKRYSANCFSLDDPAGLTRWIELLKSGNERERQFALIVTPDILKYPEILDRIFRALNDKNPCVREAAAACLKQFGKEYQRFFKKKYYKKERTPLQKEYTVKQNYLLSKEPVLMELDYNEIGDIIVPHLIKALTDGEPRVRGEAAKALSYYYDDEKATDELIKTLNDQNVWVRLNAAFALGEIRALRATDPLLNLLENNSIDWRIKFVQQESIIAIDQALLIFLSA